MLSPLTIITLAALGLALLSGLILFGCIVAVVEIDENHHRESENFREGFDS